MPKYHNFFRDSKSADMLELSKSKGRAISKSKGRAIAGPAFEVNESSA
jgi:hypothetical protein